MPTTKTFEKTLEKLNRSNQKVKEVLERELEAARGQGEAAHKSAEEAQGQIEDLSAKRPELAASVFAGDAEYSALDELDSELARVGRHLEVAEIAEEEAGKRAVEIEERLKAAEREATEARFDLYAQERRSRSEELEQTLTTLTGQLDGLIALDQEQRQEAGKLDMSIGVSYREALDNRLRCKLFRYVQDVGPFVSRLSAKSVAATLPESDPLATTLQAGRETNAATVAETERVAAQREAGRQAKARYDKFSYRRSELRARHGYDPIEMMPGRIQQIDERVNDELRRSGYAEEVDAEEAAALEQRRLQLRRTLAPDEDPEGMSEERKQEVEAAIDSWLEGEVQAVPAV